ncbi:MAG: diguanylate cyclase [Pseudomonadota bacterium]
MHDEARKHTARPARLRPASWLGVCAGLFVAGVLAAAPVAPPATVDRAVELQQFTPEQGLGSLAANVLLRDRQGVLWVGTERGLFRFDGIGFQPVRTSVDPLDLAVNDLYLSPAGRLWVGTRRHLYTWDGNDLHRVADLPVDDLQRIAGDGGEGVYVRHQRQLWHVREDGEVQVVQWPQALTAGALTDGPLLWLDGSLWASCGPALCQRSGSVTRIWGAADGVPADSWIALHASPEGDLWAGGDGHLLHRRAGENRFVAVASPHPLDALDLDSEGRVLAASAGAVWRWSGTAWTTFSDDRTLQHAHLRDLLADPAGAIWLASGGRGVLRWRGYGQFQNWTTEQGLDSAPTWAIARDADGWLWFGNQRRGNRLAPGATVLSPWPAALQRPDWTDAMAIVPHGRQLWIVFNHGVLVRYDLDSKQAAEVATHLGWAKFALADAQGRLWIGTHGMLWRVDAPDAARPAAQALLTGLPPDTSFLGAAVDARGRVWVATTHGLLRFADGRFARIDLGAHEPPGGFADVAVTPDGTLWLAPVKGGLLRGKAGPADRIDVRDAGDPLLGETALYSLDVDPVGRLWAFHGAGVDVYAGGRWRRLDHSDGLVWNELATGAFLADDDGSIWLGTAGGVSHVLHPGRLDATRLPPTVLLDARYGDVPIAPGSDIALPWSRHALAVSLAQPGITHPGEQQWQYRLDPVGAPPHWETATTPWMRYPGVEPGRYRFQARVYDPALRVYAPPVGFQLQVRPPWWQTTAARIGYVLLIALALWALWRWRHARLLRRQALLEQMVRERTLALEEDKRALEVAHRALQYEASHDALTGLLNRGAAIEALVRMVGEEGPPRRRVAVALIDLDHFKRINDTWGHLAGDAVLVQCAGRLRMLAPDDAALGRYGGEELLVVWPGLSGDVDLAGLFAPLMDAPYRHRDAELRVTCSVGVTWARAGEDVNAILHRADTALYEAKERGRARVVRAD